MLAGGVDAVRFHLQDDWNFCGNACLQMVLCAWRLQLPDQEGLVRDLRSRTDSGRDWFSAPARLRDVLNLALLQADPAVSYTLHDDESPRRLSYALAWHLHSTRMPAIVLGRADHHWMVVTRASLDREPKSAHDTSFRIKSFLYLSPRYENGVAPSSHDCSDACYFGSLGETEASYEEWLRDVLLPVASEDFDNKCIMLSGSTERPPEDEGLAPQEPVVRLEQFEQDLKDLGALEDPRFAEAIQGSEIGQVMRVQPQGEGTSAYTIVAFRKEGRTVALMTLLGNSPGRYGQLTLIPPQHRLAGLRPVQTAEDVSPVIRDALSELLKGAALPISVSPTWRPSAISRSPFEPFFRVQVGPPANLSLLYFDGRIFRDEDLRLEGLGG